MDELVTTVLDAFHRRSRLTRPEICGIAGKRFNEEILSDTVYHILVRDPRLKSCLASPMDERRAEVDEDALREYFAGLCQTVSGTPAHFVWNMDDGVPDMV
jgi:hypothetical protein